MPYDGDSPVPPLEEARNSRLFAIGRCDSHKSSMVMAWLTTRPLTRGFYCHSAGSDKLTQHRPNHAEDGGASEAWTMTDVLLSTTTVLVQHTVASNHFVPCGCHPAAKAGCVSLCVCSPIDSTCYLHETGHSHVWLTDQAEHALLACFITANKTS